MNISLSTKQNSLLPNECMQCILESIVFVDVSSLEQPQYQEVFSVQYAASAQATTEYAMNPYVCTLELNS